MGTWFTPDGDLRKYGPESAEPGLGGEYLTNKNVREIEFKVDLTTLTEAETILSDTVVMPAGFMIQEVETVTNVAAATGVAIDMGLIRTDRATPIDADGLLAAVTTATMNSGGEKVTYVENSAGGGDLIGTITAFPAYFTMSRTTATAFTAGQVLFKVRYYKP